MIKNLFALFITILFHSITFSQSNNLDSISIVGPNIVCQGLNNQYKTNLRFIGQKNSLGQHYITRNCFFEPSSFEHDANRGEININKIRYPFCVLSMRLLKCEISLDWVK